MGKLYTATSKNNLPLSYNITVPGPFDGRDIVENEGDLYLASTWKGSGNDNNYYHYKGMKVTVSSTGDIYTYIGDTKSIDNVKGCTNKNNWKLIGANNGGTGNYTKPTTGIPVTDLDKDTQDAITNAANAITTITLSNIPSISEQHKIMDISGGSTGSAKLIYIPKSVTNITQLGGYTASDGTAIANFTRTGSTSSTTIYAPKPTQIGNTIKADDSYIGTVTTKDGSIALSRKDGIEIGLDINKLKTAVNPSSGGLRKNENTGELVINMSSNEMKVYTAENNEVTRNSNGSLTLPSYCYKDDVINAPSPGTASGTTTEPIIDISTSLDRDYIYDLGTIDSLTININDTYYENLIIFQASSSIALFPIRVSGKRTIVGYVDAYPGKKYIMSIIHSIVMFCEATNYNLGD